MKYHMPPKCTECGETMEVTKLHCNHCQTELTGNFAPCKFCMLEEKHRQFIEVFLRCRGSIKEVERVMGISYPTVRNMMDQALAALGLDEKPETQKQNQDRARQEVLSRLAEGEIDADTAIGLLNELKGAEK